jgi:hypothetical protein
MYRPLKAFYIKSNPGTEGDGLVENVVYERIRVEQAVWWLLWVGPQQQNQPGRDDTKTGCSFAFPFYPECPTQPLVSFRNISFRDIVATNTLPIFEGPGVLLCDPSNPCEVNFHNFQVSFFEGGADEIFNALPIKLPEKLFPTKHRSTNITMEYITSSVVGSVTGKVSPMPCVNDPTCDWDGKARW